MRGRVGRDQSKSASDNAPTETNPDVRTSEVNVAALSESTERCFNNPQKECRLAFSHRGSPRDPSPEGSASGLYILPDAPIRRSPFASGALLVPSGALWDVPFTALAQASLSERNCVRPRPDALKMGYPPTGILRGCSTEVIQPFVLNCWV